MRFLLTVAALLLPLVPLAIADTWGDCDSKGNLALGVVEVSPLNDPASTFYVDDRNYLLGNGLWIYEESNGHFHDRMWGDLQIGGHSNVVPGDNDICDAGDPNGPDQLIF
jgi:hypothetical protein